MLFSSTSSEQLITAASLQWCQAGEKLFLTWPLFKFPEWFAVEIHVNFLCSTMSLSKITGMDILVKHLTILMSLVTVPRKLTNHFSWIIRNSLTLEKPFPIMAGCRDQQYYRKKTCLLKNVLVLKINIKLCLLLEAQKMVKESSLLILWWHENL